ncbi:uncharacterized protein [Anoplolepis gracilipes]|uniref:uncharacterized protein n=1 Tax=Anoplolepis gracilipes TaxID=354296 RepID=UPI003B9F581A
MAWVTWPCKKGKFRLRDLDQLASIEEVVGKIVRVGECQPSDIKTGEIRFSPKNMGIFWVQYPLAAANKIIAAGNLKIGWVVARVESLKAYPLQYHRCLERGYVRERCTNATDRSGLCYNCGTAGHKAANCFARTRCVLCEEWAA